MNVEELKKKALEQCQEGNCGLAIGHRDNDKVEVRFVTMVELKAEIREIDPELEE